MGGISSLEAASCPGRWARDTKGPLPVWAGFLSISFVAASCLGLRARGIRGFPARCGRDLFARGRELSRALGPGHPRSHARVGWTPFAHPPPILTFRTILLVVSSPPRVPRNPYQILNQSDIVALYPSFDLYPKSENFAESCPTRRDPRKSLEPFELTESLPSSQSILYRSTLSKIRFAPYQERPES